MVILAWNGPSRSAEPDIRDRLLVAGGIPRSDAIVRDSHAQSQCATSPESTQSDSLTAERS